jgi:hypothetical protein
MCNSVCSFCISDQGSKKDRLKKIISLIFGLFSAHLLNTSLPLLRYKKSAGNIGVLTMLSEIKNDAKVAEEEAIKNQQDAVNAYNEFVANTNSSKLKLMM